jgi:hypothetical protein
LAVGDRLRVAVEGGVVRYYKNGALLYTSSVTPAATLRVDTAIYNTGGQVANATLCGGAVSSVTKYYQLGGKRVALRNAMGVTYLHGDHLGSASVTSGATSNSARYLPFGGTRWESGVATDTLRGFTGQRQESSFG